MRKGFVVFTILALLLPVIAGCQSALPPASGNHSPTTVPTTQATLPGSDAPVSTPEAVSRITPEEAVDIALKDAGLKKDAVRDLDVELDRETAGTHYDVDFESGGHDYEYEIDALSGKILQARKERD